MTPLSPNTLHLWALSPSPPYPLDTSHDQPYLPHLRNALCSPNSRTSGVIVLKIGTTDNLSLGESLRPKVGQFTCSGGGGLEEGNFSVRWAGYSRRGRCGRLGNGKGV